MPQGTELSRGIAAQVGARLKEAKITPRDVEELTAGTIAATTLRRRVSGQGKPFDIDELGAIARLLGITITDITAAAEAAAA